MRDHQTPTKRWATAAVAGIGVLVAVGIVFALRDSNTPPAGTAPTWGARCTFKVEPPSGEPLDQATDRALDVLSARATALLWSRYTFSSPAPGTIDGTIQATQCAEDIGELTSSADVSVVDEASRTVVPPLDITGARWDGTRLRLLLTSQGAAAARRADRSVPLTTIWQRGRRVSNLGNFDPTAQTVDLGPDDAYGRGVAMSLVGGAQPSNLTATTTTAFGTPPALTGTTVTAVPAWIAHTTPAPAPGQLLQVVAAEGHTLFATRMTVGPSAMDWVWLAEGDRGSGESPWPCGPSPGEPFLQACPLPDDPQRVVVGRAAPEVHRIELLLGGRFVQRGRILVQDQRRLPATLANGWFIAPVTPAGKWDRSLIGYDASGKEIATLRLPVVANVLIEG